MGNMNESKTTEKSRKFSSYEVWPGGQAGFTFGWQTYGLEKQTRRLPWDFTCTDFIKNLVPSKAFTMAEILISLTIIGIIAAITLPALQANINEKTWITQRKALYSRLSQAISLMPAVNGYGEYDGTWTSSGVNISEDTAAITFITDGLSKVLKIKNICENSQLSKCGLPDKYINFVGTRKDFPKKLSQIISDFVSVTAGKESYANPQKNVDTAIAAFETMNGESVAVIYNPRCVDRNVEFSLPDYEGSGWVDPKHIYPYFCADFFFDLNGKKGPNKSGKDMWHIMLLYSSDSEVVMFNPDRLTPYSDGTLNYSNAIAYCSSKNARMANVNEGIAARFMGFRFGWLGGDTGDKRYAYRITNTGALIKQAKTNSISSGVRCLKR